jgi:chemotaxis methyl-accepting protein methylase
MIKQLQKSNHTKYNRHPIIFKSLKRISSNPKTILSFGCSSGMEILSLKELYFGESEFYGVDINAGVLEKAKDRCGFAKFYNIKNIDVSIKFDIITCMNVFCNYKRGYEEWKKDINMLLNLLQDGGLIALHNISYSIDTEVDFKTLKPVKIPEEFLSDKSCRDYGKYDKDIIFKKEKTICQSV